MQKHSIALLLALLVASANAPAQITNIATNPIPIPMPFLYQGRLNVGTDPIPLPEPANGLYDFRFRLFTTVTNGDQMGPTYTNSAVPVSNGLFSAIVGPVGIVPIPIPNPGLSLSNYPYLEIGVKTNSSMSDFTTLTPRQQLLPTPYATHAIFASQASSVASNAVSAQAIQAGSITMDKLANGAVTDVKLAGPISLAKLDHTGASAGTVLSYDGGTVSWLDPGWVDPAQGRSAAILLVASASAPGPMTNIASTPIPLPDPFLYQGRLNVGNIPIPLPVPADGLYDFRFSLHIDLTNSEPPPVPSVTNFAVAVSNGLFTTTIDSVAAIPISLPTPPKIFTNGYPYLEIGLRTNNSLADFTTLTSRQQLLPAPYAGHARFASQAGSVASNAVSAQAIQAGAITVDKLANGAVTDAKIAAAQVVKSLNGLKDQVVLGAGSNIVLSTQGNTVNIAATIATGPQGAQGVPGPRGLTWRGNWSASSNYVADDAVQSSGSAWLAKRTNNNVAPSGGADWSLLAQKGDTGPQGLQGVMGPTGVAGPQGATGPIGLQGPIGLTGATGATGPQGAIGATGPQGPPGSADAWSRTGNAGTTNGVNFLGTTDNQPLELRVNSQPRLRMGVNGSVALGANTTASGASSTAMGFATLASGDRSTAIGDSTTASADDSIAIGSISTASGAYSTAMGNNAKAARKGTFVWADRVIPGLNFDPYSYPEAGGIDDSFNIRASGGVHFMTAVNSTNGRPTAGMWLGGGGSGWNVYSDRQAKTNFVAVDGRAILNHLATFPILAWNYKTQDPSVRHIGPMAQDFNTAFQVGEGDKTGEKRYINTLDADGVALAAIQGLNEIMKEKNAEIEELKAAVAQLKALVSAALQESNRSRK